MKMRSFKFLPALLLLGFLGSCKPKDADVKTSIEEKIKSLPNASGISVDVKDGVATLSGSSADDATKTQIENAIKDIKGVQSVADNITVITPVVAPTNTSSVAFSGDDALTKGVTDAIKDFPGVNATVKDGIVSLTGSIKKTSLPKLFMALNALKPKKVENKLSLQ